MARDQFQTLTEQMYYILLALCDVKNGSDITNFVQTITQGRVKLAPGTLYALLGQFLDNGFIQRVDAEKVGKYYRITEDGRNLLEEEQKRLQVLVGDFQTYYH